jgi:hypothetical protein
MSGVGFGLPEVAARLSRAEAAPVKRQIQSNGAVTGPVGYAAADHLAKGKPLAI